ncbi:DUF4304 domain-containing protein [Peribacillus frigoritolerans]|uniref:DUF4304 domain-containing protein n=1 Tax=Peribacillus frigoritolerans TaxID=450367 RepID=UPI002EAFD67A|nr:DUF4304 domain-containing protein [Peribacillus frigoritolerans]
MASNERKMMDNALKKVVIPVLRKLEFKGSLPHFRRKNEKNIDLITSNSTGGMVHLLLNWRLAQQKV